MHSIHYDLHYLNPNVHGLPGNGDRVHNNFQQKTTREPVIKSSLMGGKATPHMKEHSHHSIC
jgi:hypothetical protein